MRKQKNIALLTASIVALASLLTSAALMPMRSARAQTVGGSWAFTGSLNTARIGHTATPLKTGKILIAAGDSQSAELYDPATGAWSYTGSLIQRRRLHTATLLPNGEVLVAGGYYSDDNFVHFTNLNSAELYDPATGQWRPTGS